MSNPIEKHINYYQHFAPNPTAFRESLESALVYAKSSNKHLNMDLRDYFAIRALPIVNNDWKDSDLDIDELAKIAYMWADEMMKVREQ